MNIGKIKPIKLTKGTAYLAGAIIGDGYIRNGSKSRKSKSPDYKIVLEVTEKEYMQLLYSMIKQITRTKSTPFSVKPKRRSKRTSFRLQITNKSFYYFLTKSLGIPNGAKSSKVFIPNNIREAPRKIKKHFLAGLFDTDGGFRGNSLGFTTASKKLNDELHDLLIEFSIVHSKQSWINRTYNKEYYGIKMRRFEINRFLKMFPLKNEEKLVKIRKRFAGMPEWPNGTDYSKPVLE